jgi:DNA repair exonuclease SbcCD nuclease subunit
VGGREGKEANSKGKNFRADRVVKLLISHLSDTHLGASQFGLLERERDCYEAFEEAIDTSIKEGAEIVLHSGDIFDNPRPSGTALSKFADSLKKLKERDIHFLFVLGEHDISRIPGTPSALLFEKIGLGNYIGTGEPIRVKGIDFVGFNKYRKTESEELVSQLRKCEKSKRENRSILVLHQALYEVHKYAGEISVNDLPANFDYYAMGHLHERYQNKFSMLNGYLCYPGSTDPTGVEGFESSEKGFYIVDLSSREAEPNWIKLQNTRPQLNVDVEYGKLEDEIKKLIESFSSMKKKPVIRLKITGSNIDPALVSSKIKILAEHSLYYDWQPFSKEQEGLRLVDRPADLEAEVMRIATELLKREDLAYFAVSELLPLLSGERDEDVSELLWDTFEKRRFAVR